MKPVRYIKLTNFKYEINERHEIDKFLNMNLVGDKGFSSFKI